MNRARRSHLVGEFFQVCDGKVMRLRSERALMDTLQLAEERILELAAASAGPTRK